MDKENEKTENSIADENQTPLELPSQEDEIKPEKDEEDATTSSELDATNGEEESTQAPPDFNKVCEEIDQFIAALSIARQDGSDPPPDAPICVEQFAILVEEKISHYDSGDNHLKWNEVSKEDSSHFLDAIHRTSKLFSSLSEFSSQAKYALTINCVGGVHQHAMSYVEGAFRTMLEEYTIPDPNEQNQSTNLNDQNSDSIGKHDSSSKNEEAEQSTDSESTAADHEDHFPGYSEEVASNLNKLATAMMQGGYEIECCQVYFVSRRNALEDSLHRLGLEKLSIDEVQKVHWDALEREINCWNKSFRQCCRALFPRERSLAQAVFTGYESVSDTLFGSLFRGFMIQFFNFAEAVTMTKRTTEKLFKFLDIYEALHEFISTLAASSPADCAEELKSEATLTRSRIGEAMIFIFGELENSIKADVGKTPVPAGAVHPLTRYTTNYLKFACEYKDTLEEVFRQYQKIDRAYSAGASDYDYNSQSNQSSSVQVEKQSPLEVQILKTMDLLDANLDAKSKLYKDPSLSLIFLMNNGRYIVQKVRGSKEINSLLGDNWCRKRSSDLQKYHKNYQRETWGRLLGCLSHEGLNVNGKVVKPVLKERFKSFNAMFDEIHKAQSTWVVADEQLKSELRVSISAVVIPAYRSFMARFGQYLTPGRQSEKYVKYQPEDIETHIDELFDGNAAPAAGRWRV